MNSLCYLWIYQTNNEDRLLNTKHVHNSTVCLITAKLNDYDVLNKFNFLNISKQSNKGKTNYTQRRKYDKNLPTFNGINPFLVSNTQDEIVFHSR